MGYDACYNYLKLIYGFFATILLWIYYIFGHFFFFTPIYLGAYFFSSNREFAFQRLNHIFYKSFFFLTRLIIPGFKILVDKEVFSIRSSIIVCNHLSYLDPILFISLFKKQKTIVKSTFFNIPIFGWYLKTSGYLPSTAQGQFSDLLIKGIEDLNLYLSLGGNLFVFPEGTRSKDGKLNSLNKGVFSIARRIGAPIKVLRIKNTHLIFRPGKFIFNTWVNLPITVELMASVDSDFVKNVSSMSQLMDHIKSIYEK